MVWMTEALSCAMFVDSDSSSVCRVASWPIERPEYSKPTNTGDPSQGCRVEKSPRSYVGTVRTLVS
jgi:hypothetical protein